MTEITNIKPYTVKTESDSDDSTIQNSTVTEKQFKGKIVRIYPSWEYVENLHTVNSTVFEKIGWTAFNLNPNKDTEEVRYP